MGVWIVSNFGAEEITVLAGDALEAAQLVRQRANEGDEQAAALVNPDRIELLASIDIC